MHCGLTALLLAGTCLCALADGARNDIPSCYDALKLADDRPAGRARELIVAIDETVLLSRSLQESVYQHALRFVQPGDSVRLYQFSAYLAGKYFGLPFAGTLEAPLPDKLRNSIGMNTVRQLDACLQQQMDFFRKEFGQKLLKGFAKPGTDIARSEIFLSLQQIGLDAQANGARDRVMLLVSDMLENSDFANFYAGNRIRDIDPAQEMRKVDARKLIPDLQGVRIFVLGAGMVPQNARNTYRSGQTLQLLEIFWRDYFTRAKGTLEAFGAPELTVDLR